MPCVASLHRERGESLRNEGIECRRRVECAAVVYIVYQQVQKRKKEKTKEGGADGGAGDTNNALLRDSFGWKERIGIEGGGHFFVLLGRGVYPRARCVCRCFMFFFFCHYRCCSVWCSCICTGGVGARGSKHVLLHSAMKGGGNSCERERGRKIRQKKQIPQPGSCM